jgi:hypothetical protein
MTWLMFTFLISTLIAILREDIRTKELLGLEKLDA